MAQNRSDNIQSNVPKNLDNKKGVFDNGVWRAYNSTTEANTLINIATRYKTLTVPILKSGVAEEYWYRDGVADGDLIEKQASLSGLATTEQLNTEIGNRVNADVALQLQVTAHEAEITSLQEITMELNEGVTDITSDLTAEITNRQSADTTLQTNINAKAPINNPTFTGTVSGVTKAMVGLSNVDNTSDVSKPVSTAQQTALNLKAPINNPTFTGTVGGITKGMVGLGNVDNTADTAKPVSTAQQTALNLKADTTALTAKADKTYVDAQDAGLQTQINSKLSAGDIQESIFIPQASFTGGVTYTNPALHGTAGVDYQVRNETTGLLYPVADYTPITNGFTLDSAVGVGGASILGDLGIDSNNGFSTAIQDAIIGGTVFGSDGLRLTPYKTEQTLTWVSGYYVGNDLTTINANPTYYCTTIDVVEGDGILIEAPLTVSMLNGVTTSSLGTAITKYVVPQGVTKLAFNAAYSPTSTTKIYKAGVYNQVPSGSNLLDADQTPTAVGSYDIYEVAFNIGGELCFSNLAGFPIAYNPSYLFLRFYNGATLISSHNVFDFTRSTVPLGTTSAQLWCFLAGLPTDLVQELFVFNSLDLSDPAFIIYDLSFKNLKVLSDYTDAQAMVTTGENLFNKNAPMINAYLGSGGSVNMDANSLISHFIPVLEGASYWVQGLASTNGNTFGCFYSEANDADVIGSVYTIPQGNGGGKIAPVGAKYFRFTVYLATTTSDSVRLDNVMVAEQIMGRSYPRTFVPYTLGTPKALNTANIYDKIANPIRQIVATSVGNSIWTGKKIVICGTSITDLQPTVGYFGKAMAKLAVTNAVNSAQGGSSTTYQSGGTAGLSATIAERNAAGSGQPSYEEVIMPQIATTDLFIFEHGYNTAAINSGLGDINFTDAAHRNTFVGSMNYIIYEMKKINPFVKIGLIGHWNTLNRPDLIASQDAIASRWNIPILRLGKLMGGSDDMVNATFTINGVTITANRSVNQWYSSDGGAYAGDNVHPYNPLAQELMSELLANWLRGGMV